VFRRLAMFGCARQPVVRAATLTTRRPNLRISPNGRNAAFSRTQPTPRYRPSFGPLTICMKRSRKLVSVSNAPRKRVVTAVAAD
jgi:hypothetical protein